MFPAVPSMLLILVGQPRTRGTRVYSTCTFPLSLNPNKSFPNDTIHAVVNINNNKGDNTILNP